MIQRGYCASLSLETLLKLAFGDLDGDGSVQPRVAGL
jgi:hypothetical protein